MFVSLLTTKLSAKQIAFIFLRSFRRKSFDLSNGGNFLHSKYFENQYLQKMRRGKIELIKKASEEALKFNLIL